MQKQSILVTGAAGFIGFHTCKKLLSEGYQVIGLDAVNDYYDVQLKYDRLKELGINSTDYNIPTTSTIHHDDFVFIKLNLEDAENLPKLFEKYSFDVVCNLAAQAGVRYSIENPMAYINSNIVGFTNLLECLRNFKVPKLVYASSSSIYGMNKKVPFSVEDTVDYPISVYAASKKSNELLAHTYSHLFDIQTIGLRFFTVYGPWGRPDMAMHLFTDAIVNDRPIKVFNHGDLSRDFTYIDDIVEGVYKTLTDNSNEKGYSIYNIGNGSPIQLTRFIEAIEKKLKKEAKKAMLPMQPGDVVQTWADTSQLELDYNYSPNTSIEEGVNAYIDWFLGYYNINN